MTIDGRLDPLLGPIRNLPAPAPSPARAARTRARCHAALEARCAGPNRSPARFAKAADAVLALGTCAYAAAVIVEALRVVLR
jgi:hypothetical protein